MLNFNIDLKHFEKGSKVVKDKARKVLKRSMFKMEELAIDKAPFYKGYLRERIKLLPKILSGNYVLYSFAKYSEDLEYGNTPREVKLDILAEWAERKGITSGDDTFAFAKYVQKKIRTEGVNAQPFMRPALFEVETFWYPKFLKEEFSGIKE